jgi:tripeptide aminopeptidase
MPDVLDRFLRYVTIDTQSDPDSETFPSTAKQRDLLLMLQEELRELGLSDIKLDEWSYLTATLPANIPGEHPVVGFFAHVDTSSAVSGKDVNPRVVPAFDGKDIPLDADGKYVLTVKDSPDLKDYIGQDLVVTDGSTLLGADDKAGVAAIMSAVKFLVDHPGIPHGTVKVALTPDEEIGRGMDHFDVPAFGADLAYTVDGGAVGEFEYENFNAASAVVTIHGKSYHPGTAKGLMLNAAMIAMEFQALLPAFDRPEFTEKREGFFHLISISGECEQAVLEYIIRDHDKAKYQQRKQTMLDAAAFLNQRYGAGTVEVALRDSYFNMQEMIAPHPWIVETALQAYKDLDIEPRIIPIRGGTDGARLSYMGLPCPNIFTGGHNAHGRFEYIPVQSMEQSVQVILRIIALLAEKPAA